MARVGALLLALAVVAARGPSAVADPPKETPEQARKRFEATEREEEKKLIAEVNAAIDRGHAAILAWLKEQQARGDGHYYFATGDDSQNLGRLALLVLTAVKCGSKKADPVVRKAAADMLAAPDDKGIRVDYAFQKQREKLRTYSAAVVLLALDALNAGPPPPLGEKKPPAPKGKCRYPAETETTVREIVDWLVSKQEKNVWRYPGGAESNEDLSNTQYALLAFLAAGRCSVEAPKESYRKVLDYLLAAQEKDGPDEQRWVENPSYVPGLEDRYGPFMPVGKAKARGWRYLDFEKTAVTGSMTTAGVACLAIVKERLEALGDLDKETRGKIDRAMVDGLAWMQRHFAVDKNPGQGSWHYYYLYGLERVGALTGLRYIGKNDWYREGAKYLLSEQQPDGWWPEAGGEHAAIEDRIVQTCFALLFLRRATVPPAKPLGPVVTEGG